MPRRSSKRRVRTDDESEDDGPASPRRRSRTDDDDDDVEQEMEVSEDAFAFSQQPPEASQGVPHERQFERRNLDNMDHVAREKALTSLSRTILFKALDREPIERIQVVKDAGLGANKIGSAAIIEAADRLRNVFGFELSRVPKYMEQMKGLPPKCEKRLYVLNGVSDTDDGLHSKAIHAVHLGSSIEKGLLILVLALTFCQGESRADGSRWILGRDLYRLIHMMDDSVPSEPPAAGTSRAKAVNQKVSRFQNSENTTPNVDALLEKFVHWDYLIKQEATEENFSSQTLEEGDMLYSMGPRAAMEIGRKQIIYFCAEILDEEPDATMLKEVEEDMDEEEEDMDLGGEEIAAH